ncbi:MAG: hypothetical protein JW982_10055 [Spirochaetes bacterium]|nr:hypothetical protein [Spirochaetota bacterium]
MNEEINNSINKLYEIFSNVPRPVKIDACPCCVDKKQIFTLLNKQLREITPDEMSGYASSVFLTAGSENDFRYFLPRILDILINNSGWWPDPEIIGRAMQSYGWNRFTENEQSAISNFFDSVLITDINSPDSDGDFINTWLCTVSYFYPDWDKYLEIITKKPKALVSLYECHSNTLMRNKLSDGFWNDSPKDQEFINWINSDKIKSLIKNAYGL